jgi:hypothetical protein
MTSEPWRGLTEAGHGSHKVDEAHAPVAVEETRRADKVHNGHDLEDVLVHGKGLSRKNTHDDGRECSLGDPVAITRQYGSIVIMNGRASTYRAGLSS